VRDGSAAARGRGRHIATHARQRRGHTTQRRHGSGEGRARPAGCRSERAPHRPTRHAAQARSCEEPS
jgi:hypothetical protein